MRRLALLFLLLPAFAVAATITSGTCSPSNTTGCANLAVASPSTTASVSVQVTGTWVATLEFEGSLDGVNYRPLLAIPSSGGAYTTYTTSNDIWQVHTSGAPHVRVRASSYTSGTAVVLLSANTAPPFTDVVRAVGGTFGPVQVSGTIDANLTQTTLTALDPPCTFVAAPPRTSLTTTPADVPATPLTGRTQMLVLNLSSTQEVWCCRGAGCTPTSTAAYVIRKDGVQEWNGIRDTTIIRCRSQAGTADINVQEASCG